MKKSLLTILSILLFSVLLFVQCDKDDPIPAPEPEPEPIEETIISEKAKVFTDTEWTNSVVSVDSNFVFKLKDNSKNLTQGDIIVGTEDGGYLRKVKEVTTEGGETIVKTEFASITDAVEKASVNHKIVIEPDTDSEDLWFAEGGPI